MGLVGRIFLVRKWCSIALYYSHILLFVAVYFHFTLTCFVILV